MNLESIRDEALRMAEPQFKQFEPIALHNTKKVLEAFKACQLSDYHLMALVDMAIMIVAVKNLMKCLLMCLKLKRH